LPIGSTQADVGFGTEHLFRQDFRGIGLSAAALAEDAKGLGYGVER
jgi:hypothetical protein